MSSYQNIITKLERFIKKYYTNQLIKGSLLFVTLGMLFWLAVMSLEYWLWLGNTWRLMLLLLFIGVELMLLYKFIAIPVFYLSKFRKGIDYKQASRLIGKHFSEVDDKLLNLLELKDNPKKSDLVLASIEQRAKGIGVVPFAEAIDFRDSLKYAKYVFLPIALLAFIWISGNIVSFFNSYERVVNYDLAYEKPAPFSFLVLNDTLHVLDNEPLTIRVATEGKVKPDQVSIVINEETLLLRKQEEVYTYTFEAPVKERTFYLTANGWNSKLYHVYSHETPTLMDFAMELRYPEYLNRPSEMITGTGNAIVPEGTQVNWSIEGSGVDTIRLSSADTSLVFLQNGKQFLHSDKVYTNLHYELSTSNAYVNNFERLTYTIEVIKDAKATVQVEQVLDPSNPNQSYFMGQAADDYGIHELRLVCYPTDDTQGGETVILENPNTNVYQFYYTFPSGLQLEPGKNYELYFEVVDNDGLRGGKVTRSRTFSLNLLDTNQLENKKLGLQKATLSKMDRSLEEYKDQEKELIQLHNLQKEEGTLKFEERSQIKDFLQKQERQEELMKKFTKDLNQGLTDDKEDNEFKRMLQERLERQEIEALKNEKLLKELEKVTDKLNAEEIREKLEELSKNQNKSARNLEQLLELTKRYYVTEKMSQLARELEQTAKEQENLSQQNQENLDEQQEELNNKFDRLSEQLNELRKDNQLLQKPISFEVTEQQQQEVKDDQKGALKNLESKDKSETNSKSAAVKQQKAAAQKMKEMSEALQNGAMGGSGSQDTEDAEMLRQILDNLITFSFQQEGLFDRMQTSDLEMRQFSKNVREQNELRRLFEHIDDSLFTLSLRRVELSELVNKQITEVYYNIDKSLESIAENQIYQSASYQQYVINATNTLADFLANILDNMLQNMQAGQGQGSGSDFQLPDIIKGQQSIGDKMNGTGKEGKSSEKQGKQQGNDKGKGQAENGDEGKRQSNERKVGNGESQGVPGDEMGKEEMDLNEVYEIYKEQQKIRQLLEQQLQNLINEQEGNLAKKLLRQMEDFEKDLLENGVTERTRSKANTIEHELMKLENATLEQGREEKRESSTTKQNYTNPITTRPELLKDYQNNIEILNRQALPLREKYEHKVKVYFKND